MRGRAAAIAVLAVAGCATVQDSPPDAPAAVQGVWGGQHVGLEMGETSGRLDYDCAAGMIDEPLRVAPDGSFAAIGRHTPGHGGPERIGQVNPIFRARYSGRVRGDEMTLTVRVENGVLIGPYSLRRGTVPNLMRCL